MFNFPSGSDGKASVYNVRDLGSIPGLGRFPGEGNGNPLQYSCLGNPIEYRGAWRATIYGVTRVRQDLANKPPPRHFKVYKEFPRAGFQHIFTRTFQEKQITLRPCRLTDRLSDLAGPPTQNADTKLRVPFLHPRRGLDDCS